MRASELTLAFETITEGDIPELTQVMTRAFDDDAQKHLGLERDRGITGRRFRVSQRNGASLN